MAQVRPFAEGFMIGINEESNDVRLCGVECADCGIVLFGERNRCENCANDDLETVTFSRQGEIASYTVQRHPPGGPYKLGNTDADEWDPRPVGYIDLPEGVRLLSIIEGDSDKLAIGDPVTLDVFVGWQDDETEVLVYAFEQQEGDDGGD
jgi:uncharacterized OB-fold protein